MQFGQAPAERHHGECATLRPTQHSIPGMTNPRISILLPVFNAAATLPEALNSILAQTFSAFEVIAVDDGSSDPSTDILRNAAAADPRIKPLPSHHVGLVAALEIGLRHCAGHYIARMDADDRMAPQRLQRQVAFLDTHPNVALVSSQVEIFADEPLGEGWRQYLEWQNGCLTPCQIADNIYWEAPFVHPSVMFRRDAIESIGGYRHGDFPEDYELWLRMNAAGMQMAKIPETLLFWRDHSDRLTHNDPRLSADAFNRIRMRYLADDPRLNDGRPIAIWGAGRKTRKRFRRLFDAGIRPICWIDIAPKKIGLTIDGIEVLSPQQLARLSPQPFVLAAVRSHGARALIEAQLGIFGYCRGIDYLPVG